MGPTEAILLLNVFLLAALTVVGRRNRSLPSARTFTVLQGVSGVWVGITLAGLQLQPGPLRLRVWGLTTGLSLLVVGLWLSFILSYTGRQAWVTSRRAVVVRANERARGYLGTEDVVGRSAGTLLESVDDPADSDPENRLRREGRTYRRRSRK